MVLTPLPPSCAEVLTLVLTLRAFVVYKKCENLPIQNTVIKIVHLSSSLDLVQWNERRVTIDVGPVRVSSGR